MQDDEGRQGAVHAGQSHDDEVQVNHCSAQHGVRQGRPPVLREGRDMSAPTDVSLQKLKRVGRHLKAKPRLKIRFGLGRDEARRHFDRQRLGGCHRTHKYTNGGVQ